MKNKICQRIFALLLVPVLIFNSVGPLFSIAYAEEVTPTPIVSQDVTPTPDNSIPTPTPTPEDTVVIEATPTPSNDLSPLSNNSSNNNAPTETPAVSATPTPTPSPWTFENVELNKEYVDPQNSDVKLTFTKLPSPAGNIKIDEITLTKEQIQQTGSLSDTAYDITSDMADGSFTYNLSLPIPESAKGKAVGVKSTEDISNIASAEKVDNTLTNTATSVSVANLDHFTIFVVTVVTLQPDYVAPGGGGVFSAYVGPPDYGYVSPGATAIYDGREAGIIKAGLNVDTDGHYWDEGLFAFIPTVTIDTFAAGAVTYDVENQAGVNPVWMTIEIDTGVLGVRSDNTAYQFVPSSYGTANGYHEVNASSGQWQQWTTYTSGITTGPPMTLSQIAAAHPGLNVVRAYLRLGMGDSYNNGGTGTIAWVDNVTMGGVPYDFSTTSATTKAATSVTSNDATLNGFNKSDATGHSFWVSLASFVTTSSTIPSGVYSSPDLGSIAANTDFSVSLASITTTGVPTNLPAITPGTTYYFAAWSEVGGTWYPGEVLNFTTANGPVFIDTNKNGILDSGELSFYTIQAAISAATAGDTIHVTAGTYTEAGQIVIDKNLSIVGADKTTTTIKPDANYSSGWVLVNSGITFDLSNVTLDGSGHIITKAILDQGNGIIDNNKFTEIKNGKYAGTAIAISTAENVDITNNEFTEIGRNGILADYNTGTISGNTYTGKGTGDWLDYFILSEYGDNVTISNNTISNCTGVALLDGSTSAAIAVWDDPGTQATITGNTMTNNTTGVAVVALSGGTTNPKVIIEAGNLFDGGEYGVAFQTWGPAYSPDVTFVGASTFKNQSVYAISLDTGVSVGKTINISSVIFKNSSNVVITDSSIIESLVYHFNDDPNRGLLKWDYTAPAVPSLVSPTNDAYVKPAGLILNWSDSTDPSSPVTYYYQSSYSSAVGAQNSFTSPIYNVSTGTASQIDASGSSDNLYHWQVKACDSVGNCSAWSGPWAVHIDNTAPTVPVLSAPSNSEYLTTHDFTFQWNASTDSSPLTYEWEFSYVNTLKLDGSFTSQSGDHTNLSTSVDSPGTPDNVYYWHVRAIDAAGNKSGWSNVWKVTIDTTAPAVPTGIYFKDTVNNKDVACGGITSARNFDVYWNANTETDFDHYEYTSYNTDGSTGLVDQPFTTPYFNASWWTVLTEGTYGVQIRAVDKAGNKSAWSGGAESFNNSCKYTTDWTAPTTPTATPVAGDYMSDQSVTLASSDSGNGLKNIYYTLDGTTPDNSKTLYVGAISVDHDMTIKAIAYDNAGNASFILSSTYGIPPKISAETSSLATTSTATVTWTTDDLSTSRVIYDTVSHPTLGAAPNYGYAYSSIEDSTKVILHSVGLTGLSSGTTYYYRTVSRGSPEAVSDEHSVGTSSFVSTGGTGTGDGKSDGLGCESHDCGGNSNTSSAPQGQTLTTLAQGSTQSVLGATTSDEENQNVNPTPTPKVTEEVLGSENSTVNSTNWFKPFLVIIIFLIVAGSVGYWVSRKRRNN